jgi:hypothetical protein
MLGWLKLTVVEVVAPYRHLRYQPALLVAITVELEVRVDQQLLLVYLGPHHQVYLLDRTTSTYPLPI